jgi:hypothetical protein
MIVVGTEVVRFLCAEESDSDSVEGDDGNTKAAAG